jgi:SAM-dependent methyltransferase
LRNLAERIAGTLRRFTRPADLTLFHVSKPAALLAYSVFNRNYPNAKRELNSDLIGRAIDFGYLHWPRSIRSYVQDKSVLDVGCGMGFHSIGYVVVGVRSYTGVDPLMKLNRKLAKHPRTREWEEFNWAPREIMEQFSRVHLIRGKVEDLPDGTVFDVAVLHNVTEHLIQLEDVFRAVATRLRPDGKLIFLHHNFFCWSGHHMRPKTIDDIDPDDVEQKKYMDWAHIRFVPSDDHYFLRGLNKLRLDELRAITERHYDIEEWKEIPSRRSAGGERLTDEIVERFPELTRRDLDIHNVFCVARRR